MIEISHVASVISSPKPAIGRATRSTVKSDTGLTLNRNDLGQNLTVIEAPIVRGAPADRKELRS